VMANIAAFQNTVRHALDHASSFGLLKLHT
jgi:hypothetical protein